MRIGIMGVHYGHIGGMIQSASQATNGQIVGLVEDDDALCARYASIPRFATLEDMIDRAQSRANPRRLDPPRENRARRNLRPRWHSPAPRQTPVPHARRLGAHAPRCRRQRNPRIHVVHLAQLSAVHRPAPSHSRRRARGHRQPHLHPPAQDLAATQPRLGILTQISTQAHFTTSLATASIKSAGSPMPNASVSTP